MAFLEIRGVGKRFGTLDVLTGIEIAVEEGSFLVLVGPSGCGKSTLLNIVAGLESASEGEIRIGGVRVNELHPSKRDIAMVFQSYALYPNMTVAGNMAFGMEMRGVPRVVREKAVADVARTLQIEHLLRRRPGQLSGGQRQRVAMGRALVRKPQVFLFDEPLSNLDAKLRVDMRTEIKRLHQALGTTIVYVTHDQVEAMTLATQIAVMNAGAIQQLGTPQEIYNRPATMFVAGFMGSPAMNMIPATLESNGTLRLAMVDGGAIRLAMPTGAIGESASRAVVLGLRPEAITDPDSADRKSRAVVLADCPIDVVEPAGSDTFAVTRLAGVEVIARLRGDANLRPGSTTPLAFNMEKAVLFDPDSQQRIT